jgi:hypothetical protein
MSEPQLFMFMGRQVEIRYAVIDVVLKGMDMTTAGAQPLDVMFYWLCHSAYWRDTGERVFKSPDDIRALSSEHIVPVMTMGKAAHSLNLPNFGDLFGAPADPAPAKPNGANGTHEPGPSA